MAQNYKRSNKNRDKGKPKPTCDREVSAQVLEGDRVKPNDPIWYYSSKQILNDVARVPYNIPVGMPFARYGSFTPGAHIQLQSYDDAMPGLMVSHLMPLLGNANTPSDPVNVAANSVFQFVRKSISGSRNYEAVDIMLYLGAMDSLYCYVTWLTRLYSTVFTYHEANRYLARSIIEAQHVDYDSLVSNLANFRSAVNMYIAKARALYLPSILPIFKRHTWLFSSYYIEGPTEKDQIYMHVPEGIHYFKYDSSGKGMLQAYRFDWEGNKFTYSDLIQILSVMVDPIYLDEDFNRISGDLLKTYEGKVFTLSELPDIATISLIYNEEVLLQFKNAKYKWVDCDGDKFKDNFFNYNQDSTGLYLIGTFNPIDLTNYIYTGSANNHVHELNSTSTAANTYAFESTIYEWSKYTMLTSPHSDVSPEENMVNTRLTLAMSISGDSSASWEASIDDVYFGSEWPLYYEIVTFHRNRGTHVTSDFKRKYDRCLVIEDNNATGIQQLFESQIPILSCYKFLPELSIIVVDPTSGSEVAYNAGRNMFDVDNYSLIHATTVSGMHNAAILGEYNIPELAVGK